MPQEFQSTLKGGNNDVNSLQYDGSTYSFCLNATTENSSEPQTEPYRSNMSSNVYCYANQPNEKVVGHVYITEFDKTILLTYNSITKESKFVDLKVLKKDPYTTDVINCEGAGQVEIFLNTPQCTSSVIASSTCFNWTSSPNVIYKITDCTLNFYMNNGIDEDRLINFDYDQSFNLSVNEEFLNNTGTECTPILGSISCERTKWNPVVDTPCIEMSSIPGNKKKGSYSYLIAYSTFSGIPLTHYMSLTQSFFIKEDGGGIKLELSNVSENSRYRWLSIVCIESLDGLTTVHQKATISVNQKQYIDVDNGGANISVENLLATYPFYKNSEDTTESNNILFKLGLNEYEKFNLQPVINTIELDWITVVAKEGDYSKPEFASKYKSLMRDEVYTLALELTIDNTEKGPSFPLVGRIKTQEDAITTTTTVECNTLVKEKWQNTNTSKRLYTSSKSLEDLYDNCNCAEVYQSGSFAYWESTEVYPNNPNVWGDLCGQPIRHFKMPSIAVAPHQSDNSSFDNLNHIFPLGVRIKSDVAQVLNNAVTQGLITSEQRTRIKGYKILIGDRTGNKSIIAKGLLYDVWKYTRINDKDDNFYNSGCSATPESTYHYPNYPFNDLSPDKFLSSSDVHYDSKNYASPVLQTYDQNKSKFTFHSPETSFDKPLLGNLIRYEAELYGKSRGFFNHSNDFAKYKLMSEKHFQMAKAYANFVSNSITTPTEEALAAQASALGESIGGTVLGKAGLGNLGSSLGRFVGNLVGTNIGKNTFSSMAYRHSVYLSSVEKILELFKLMSEGQQHHYQYQAVGKYNQILSVLPNQDYVITDKEYLLEGKQTVKDGNTNIYFNNQDRESSVFIKTEQVRPDYTIQDNSRVLISEDAGGGISSSIASIVDDDLVGYRIFATEGRYKFTLYKCNGDIITTSVYIADRANGGLQLNWDCLLNFEAEEVNFLGNPKKNPDGDLVITTYKTDCTDCIEQRQVAAFYPCKCNNPSERNISSFYISNKVYLANQYGSIYDVKWLPTSSCSVDFDNPGICDNIHFGGDTFIGRFAIKRKHNFFTRNTHKLDDEVDFNYSLVPNVANPVYFFDTVRAPKHTVLSTVGINFPLVSNSGSAFRKMLDLWKYGIFNSSNIKPNNYKFDCYDKINDDLNGNSFQLKAISGIMYTYSYGVPSFITESTINLDLREDKDQPWDKFFPKESNLSNWLQESTVPIKLDNTYYYNKSFSKLANEYFAYVYDVNFKGLESCKTFRDNRVIYSAQGLNIEDSNYSDPYLVNKSLDYYDFSKKGGRAISIEGIEGDRVLVRQENTTNIYNAYIELNGDSDTVLLTTGRIFNSKPVQYSQSSNGYFGTQHKTILHTPFGHVSVDAKRGHVHLLGNGGQGLEEISNQGYRHWFSENLPFTISKQFPEVDVDNNYNGIGIAMCFDKKFNQMFITKLDYEAKSSDVKYLGGRWYLQSTNATIQLTDTKYFRNKSWTMAYSFYRKEWVSAISWTPNYYIEEIDTFLAGTNQGVWQHNITNKSYQRFFNKTTPFIVESISKGALNNSIVKNVDYYADFIRYHNDYDYYYDREAKFDKAVVYGQNSNSGTLYLDKTSSDYNTRTHYPIPMGDGTKVELSMKEGQHSFNQFTDKVKLNSKLPHWLFKANNLDKFLNLQAFNFGVLEKSEYIRDSIVRVRLIQDSDTRNKIIFKGVITDKEQSWR